MRRMPRYRRPAAAKIRHLAAMRRVAATQPALARIFHQPYDLSA